MDVPGVVTEVLDEESVEASVALGGDDALFVTPTRTLVYRSEGLLSDESVEEYTHEVERVAVSEGRRKATITMANALGDEQTLTVTAEHTDEVLESVLEGVLRVNRVIDADEDVVHLFRLSELSVILTNKRLLKYVGAALWDEDYETAPYADVTGLTTEEGEVSTQIVLEVGGRPQRIKAPTSTARKLRERLEAMLRTYHDITEPATLNAALTREDPEAETAAASDSTSEADVDALATTISEVTEAPEEEADTSDPQLADTGFEPPAEAEPAVARELTELRATVEEQTELLNRQQELLEQLIEELRHGR